MPVVASCSSSCRYGRYVAAVGSDLAAGFWFSDVQSRLCHGVLYATMVMSLFAVRFGSGLMAVFALTLSVIFASWIWVFRSLDSSFVCAGLLGPYADLAKIILYVRAMGGVFTDFANIFSGMRTKGVRLYRPRMTAIIPSMTITIMLPWDLHLWD